MRYLSVCSGIESATVAWEPLGWTPVAFAETAVFPSRVLAHRWPRVPNLGDMTAIDPGTLGPVDLLVGGTPCQAFSVAGRGLSLDDPRGRLSLAFADLSHGLAEHNGTRWVLWENVPGVLSRADNAFGCLVGRLVGADGAVPLPRGAERWPDAGVVAGPRGRAAWRVLDAQYFGLAQRRRRVFVVVGLGDGTDPCAVLFERQGLRRHPPARGEPGQGVARPLAASAGDGRGHGVGGDDADSLIAHALRAQHNHSHREDQDTLVPIAFGGNDTRGPIDVAAALGAHGGPCGHLDFASETFVASLAGTLPAGANATGGNRFPGTSAETAGSMLVPIAFDCKAGGDTGFSIGDLPGSLRGLGHGGGHAAIAFDTTQITHPENRCNPQPDDPCHPLAASAHVPAIAFQGRGTNLDLGQHVTGTLGTNADRASAGAPCIATETAVAWAVRRLTPVECHRLQGFSDGHAAIPGAKDGPVYMALGNAKPVPVVRWLGRRLEAADQAIARAIAS